MCPPNRGPSTTSSRFHAMNFFTEHYGTTYGPAEIARKCADKFEIPLNVARNYLSIWRKNRGLTRKYIKRAETT